MRPILIIFLIFLCVGGAAAEDWSMYLHDPGHSSFNPNETALSPANVGNLSPVWTLSLNTNIASAPTLAKGVLYVGDWDGYFHAVRASDGALLWSQYVGKAAEPQSPGCQPAIGVTAQAALKGEAVFVGGGDSAVYALDRESGRQLWRSSVADPDSGAYLWSSIVPVDNSLYLGVASLGDCPLVRGSLARIDLDKPQAPVIKYLAPEGETGAGIWSTPAVDVRTGNVFATTGTGDQDPATGLWGGTLLSFEPKHLNVLSYFFLPTNSPELDIEWGSSTTLFQTADGTDMVAATAKDGVLYAVTRDTLQPAWTVQLAVPCICPECGCGSLSTPAFDGERLYVGGGVRNIELNASGSVWSIDPTSGAVLWEVDLGGTVIAPVTIANGVVYVGSTTGALALDAETGEQLWSDGERGLLYTQPVVADGVLYTTYLSGEVVAWGLAGMVEGTGSTIKKTKSGNSRLVAMLSSRKRPGEIERCLGVQGHQDAGCNRL